MLVAHWHAKRIHLNYADQSFVINRTTQEINNELIPNERILSFVKNHIEGFGYAKSNGLCFAKDI